MAEQKDLEVRIKAETSGLTRIAQEARKVASAFDKYWNESLKKGQLNLREFIAGLTGGAKGTRSLAEEGKKATSTFSALNKQTKQFAFIAGFIGGIAADLSRVVRNAFAQLAAIPANFVKSLISAGSAAENQIVRIQTIMRTTQQGASDLFEALLQVAEPLPVTTNEIVDSFIRLESVNLSGTAENLRIVASAALATGENMENVAAILQSLETEPLRRLGVSLDRTGKQAVISFKDIRIETAKTDKAIREGLLQLFAQAFPDGIKNAQGTLKGATATMESLIDGLRTRAAVPLIAAITGIKNEINEWLQANRELLQQKVTEFAKTFAIILTAGFEILKAFTRLLPTTNSLIYGLQQAFLGASKTALGFIKIIQTGVSALQSIGEVEASFARNNPLLFSDETIIRIHKNLDAVKTANKDMKKVIEEVAGATLDAEYKFNQLNAAQEATLETDIDLNEILARLSGGFGNLGDDLDELSEKTKKAQKELERLQQSFVKDLTGQFTDLTKEVALFGKSADDIAKYEAEAAKAKAQTLQLGSAFNPLIEAILNLQLALNRLQLKERLGEELQGVFELLRTESQKVGDELARSINTLLQNAVVNPDLVSFQEAQELIVRLTRDALEEQKKIQEELIQAEKQAYIDRLKNSESFIDQLKGGFLEFALAVESNGELAAQFFADTLSQMSQNFSDFFYNVLTGKFEDLVDVAKNAFRAILRAFLDMVSAIVTRQIVISIAGSLGFDAKGLKGAGGAGGALGLGKDALGLAGAGFGLFGGGAAAGGATAAAIGGAAGGIGGVGVTGLTGGLSVSTLAGGASTGILGTIGAAIPYVGAAVAALAIILPLLSGIFKKTPRLDIDFDSVKTDLGRRAAVVEEFLSPEFFLDNIGQVSVKRGGVGLGAGGDEKILELIQQRLQETIEGIQDVIRRLPAELFDTLNETLLNAEIDIDTVIGGERLLEFDAKGKKIAEKFQQFIEGELPAKFFLAIRESFFEPAFQALGVSADGTQSLIDQFLADMESAGSREARAAIGQEFIETFSAFVDAFNIVSGNANDAIGQTMNTIKALSSQLGFETVPSIDELRMKLGDLIESAELDPETVQMYADLRNAIVSLTAEIVNSISGLIGKMQGLNQTMASLGLATVDLGGYLSQAASQIQSFLQNQGGNLSLGEQEAFLDQLAGIANAMLAEEQAAFNATQERLRAEAQATFEAQRAVIQGRIDGLNQEKESINEAFRSRIDALNEELRLAQAFAAATESIRNTLDGIIFSQQSIFTAVERVNMLQGNISELQNQIANTSDPDRQLDLIASLESAFATLFDTAGEAFGVNSPEFVSIFDQVTGGLSDLANLTENRGRSAEEIQAEIERLTAANEAHLASIDSRIEAAQAQLSSLQQQTVDNTFVASQELQDLFAYIQGEYTRLLEERFKQLEEVSEFGFANELQGLEAIAGLAQESLVTLKDQTSYLAQIAGAITNGGSTAAGVPGFASGSGGLLDFGKQTLAFLHGREAVFTEPQLANLTKRLVRGGYVSSLANELPRTPSQVLRERTADIAGDSKKTIEVIVHGDSPTAVQAVIAGVTNAVKKEVKDEIRKEMDSTAVTLKGAFQNVARRAGQ